jgi:hypothetical protein
MLSVLFWFHIVQYIFPFTIYFYLFKIFVI